MRVLLSVVVFALVAFLASAQMQNYMAIFSPPSTIPQSGTVSQVVSWETSMADLVNLHMDLSDITQNYAYDGGATVTVQGPGAGFATLLLPISGTLNAGDKYQLHIYMTNVTISRATNYTNDWKYTAFDAYQPVTVSTAALTNSMSFVSVPSTIPSSGFFVGDVFWSSNIPGYTILHMDLGDVTQNYAYDGGAIANVSSPGSGIIKMNMSISNGVTPGQALSVGDTYDIHLYMASAVNNSLYNGADWQHVAFEKYYTATAAARTTFANSLTILNPPTMIPPTGNFTVNCAWSTNVTGVVNLHLDISDVTQSYAYDGGSMVQVVGPGAGTIPMTVSVTTTGAAADKYQLHTYLLDEVTSLRLQTGAINNDWQQPLFNAYYPVTQGIAAVVNYPYTVSVYQPPTTIPNSGVVSAVIEWSSNAPTSTTVHMDLSDITKSYAYDGGVSMTVPSPGNGFVYLSLPIIGQLNTGDAYQLHVYETGYANTTQFGSSNDWQHSAIDLYIPVVVSSAPLTNYMQLLNVPSTIPQVGTIQLEVFYTSNNANASFLHVDINDVTKSWLWETGSTVLVPTPGSGTVQMIVTTTAAMNLTIGDTFNLHGYMTSLANSTTYGSTNDWAHTSYDTYNTVTVAKAATFPISLVPVNPPASIPNTGNFTVLYAWSSNYTGEINLHVDLSDTTANWQFEAGSAIQVTSPGSGVVTFFINIGSAVLPLGDSYDLHAYIAPTSSGLLYGTSTDWQHTIFDGFTVVKAVLPSGTTSVQNSVTFTSPPSLIPATGSFTVTVAYSTNYTTGVNVHVDLNDLTQNWLFENGSFIQVPAGQQSGTLTFTITLAQATALNAGDSYDLHAYLTPTVNSNANGGVGNDWQIAIANAFAPVTVSGAPLTNSMSVLNPPTSIAIQASETFQVQWTASYAGLMNLHLDCSDVTQNYYYEGGAFAQVTGPGSGIILMQVPLNTSMKVGDNYTLHAYMTSYANSTAHGGSGNDWMYAAYNAYYPVQAAPVTSFPNSLTLLNPPTSIPASGTFALKAVYSTNIAGMILHLDINDKTLAYAYDTGAPALTVYDAGQGTVTFTLTTTALPKADTYLLHAYMTTVANSTKYGATNDWQHTMFDAYYTVSASSGTSSSSSSSGLSNGAIAGIVVGSVVGGLLVLALCVFFFTCAARSGKKATKLGDSADHPHARHEDEASTVNHQHELEMGETHA